MSKALQLLGMERISNFNSSLVELGLDKVHKARRGQEKGSQALDNIQLEEYTLHIANVHI
jgi:hypothetical protein